MGETTSLPMIIAKWQRSQRESLRITLHEDVIDLRAFYETEEEEAPRAGRVGLTLPVDWLPKITEALQKAEREARRLRLIGCSDS
jgi:hypothetical protein